MLVVPWQFVGGVTLLRSTVSGIVFSIVFESICVVGALSGMWCLQNIITFIKKKHASAEQRSAPAAAKYFDYLATRNDEQTQQQQHWRLEHSNEVIRIYCLRCHERASETHANALYVADHNVSNCCTNTWHFQWCCETWDDPHRCVHHRQRTIRLAMWYPCKR